MARRRRRAEIKKRHKFPWLWVLLPIVLLVGVWLLFTIINQNTPTNKNTAQASSRRDTTIVDFAARIDGAVRQVVLDLGIPKNAILWKRNKSIEQIPSIKFSNIFIKANSALPMAHINYFFQRTITDSGGRIIDAVEKKAGTEIVMNVGYGDIYTHHIKIRRRSGVPIEPAYVALLIDDFGYYPVPTARQFLKLGISFSASVLPNAEYTQYILRELDKHNDIERMVHIPMEPKGYPRVDPGPGAILVSQDDREIIRLVQKALETIPGAVGANNHMGSRATENKRVMYQVLRAVRDAGLFWIDSRTTQYSISEEVANSMKIPATHIDHIIDPPNLSPEEIENRLFNYCLKSRRVPAMIINCHSSDTTLQILKQNIPTLKKLGIKFITVSKALEKKLIAEKKQVAID